MSERVVIRVSQVSAVAMRRVAAARGIELGEAADWLVSLGERRRVALAKFAKAARPEPKKKLPDGKKRKTGAKIGSKKRPLGKRRASRGRRVAK
jgi:hypothetical protein